MYLFILFLFTYEEPMAVKPGDPILPITVLNMQQETINLPDIMASSMCFILSLDCRFCTDALSVIKTTFSKNHHTIILFNDPWQEVKQFLKQEKSPENVGIFVVDHRKLTPYKITTLPALLAYYKSKLRLGYYGPIDLERAKMIDNAYFHGLAQHDH